MRNYQLYLIEDVFANYFYGKERSFYLLFRELLEGNDRTKAIIKKQVHYVTKQIPYLKVHTRLIQKLQSRPDFFVTNGVYVVENKEGRAALQIFERYITIESTGSFDIEIILMDALRKMDYNFFALDLQNERYGWIKPLLEKQYV